MSSSLLTSSASSPPRGPLSEALYIGGGSLVSALNLAPSLWPSRSDGILASGKSVREVMRTPGLNPPDISCRDLAYMLVRIQDGEVSAAFTLREICR